MNISKVGIELIKKFEGCVLFGYKDPVGIPTIGYGHTGGVVVGQRISHSKKQTQLLKQDLKRFEKAVNDLGLKLNQNQFDALVSFAYNVGPGNLKKLVEGRSLTSSIRCYLLILQSRRANIKRLSEAQKCRKSLIP
jgi:lysozyme